MDYQALADLLYPDLAHDCAYYEALYPERDLPEGAMVTRFAPSPTGYLHLGGVYQVMCDERLAHRSGGVFMLRIEDTDSKRELADGVRVILDGIENGEISSEAEAGVNVLLRASFRPEFLNRLDEIVFFKPLTKDNISRIVDLLLNEITERLSEKRLKLEVTSAAKDYIAEAGYDPVYGARPLKRLIQSELETAVARFIIRSDPAPDSTVIVDYNGAELFAEGRE